MRLSRGMVELSEKDICSEFATKFPSYKINILLEEWIIFMFIVLIIVLWIYFLNYESLFISEGVYRTLAKPSRKGHHRSIISKKHYCYVGNCYRISVVCSEKRKFLFVFEMFCLFRKKKFHICTNSFRSTDIIFNNKFEHLRLHSYLYLHNQWALFIERELMFWVRSHSLSLMLVS